MLLAAYEGVTTPQNLNLEALYGTLSKRKESVNAMFDKVKIRPVGKEIIFYS